MFHSLFHLPAIPPRIASFAVLLGIVTQPAAAQFMLPDTFQSPAVAPAENTPARTKPAEITPAETKPAVFAQGDDSSVSNATLDNVARNATQATVAPVSWETADYPVDPIYSDVYSADAREQNYLGTPDWRFGASLLAYERSQRFSYGTQMGFGISGQTNPEAELDSKSWEMVVQYTTGSERSQDSGSNGYLDRESTLVDIQGNRIWRNGIEDRSLDLIAGIRGLFFSDSDALRDVPSASVTDVEFRNSMFGVHVGAGANLRVKQLFCGGRASASIMNNGADGVVHRKNIFLPSRTATNSFRTFASVVDISGYAGFNLTRHTELTFGFHAMVMNNVFTTDVGGGDNTFDEDGETVNYLGGSLMLAHHF